MNGHVPVKEKDGESPIKGNGRLFMIDGGFSKAYQRQTGIAGYTLIYNSNFMKLISHEPFAGREDAIKYNKDIHSVTNVTEELDHRLKIRESDIGVGIERDISRLYKLMEAYRSGIIPEHTCKS